MTRAIWLVGATILLASPAPGFVAEPEDAYLWLEEVTGQRPLDWVRERNAESIAALTTSGGFRQLEHRLLKILDSDDRIPAVQKHGPLYYNFWRDAKSRRGVWRRTTLAEYRRDRPDWETVIDLDTLARDENENWVWHGAEELRTDGRFALVSISRGGSDASVIREFDVTTKTFVRDGFILPEAKTRVGWRGPDSLFVGTDFGPGTLTSSGYPRVVKQWQRGTSLAAAETVFEGKPEDVSVEAFHDFTTGFERDFVTRSPTFWTSELFLRRDGKLVKVETPDDARASVHREWLFVELRSPWEIGGKTYPAGALLATDFEAFLKGERTFDVLFEPTERTSLRELAPSRHFVLLNELDNVRSKVEVLEPPRRALAPHAAPWPPRIWNRARGPGRPGRLRRLLPDRQRLLEPDHPRARHHRRRRGRGAQAAPRAVRRQRADHYPA